MKYLTFNYVIKNDDGPFKSRFKLTHNTNTLPSYPLKAGEVLLWFSVFSLTLFTFNHWRMTWANRHSACAFRDNTGHGLHRQGESRNREERKGGSHICVLILIRCKKKKTIKSQENTEKGGGQITAMIKWTSVFFWMTSAKLNIFHQSLRGN